MSTQVDAASQEDTSVCIIFGPGYMDGSDTFTNMLHEYCAFTGTCIMYTVSPMQTT